MDIRYSANPQDVKRYTTEELRKEFLIENLYVPGEVRAVYSHVDRMVILGILPTDKKVSIDQGIDVWANFGTNYFLERREAGVFNLGGEGGVIVDGTFYKLGFEDCLYISRGAKEVYFCSADAADPARFYLASAPAHKECKTQLEPGSVWNTMPAHTHERRMEVYTYFNIPEDNVVFHMMGQGNETRHIVMHNFDAVISPSWSIHAGCGTAAYTFIWAMAGENQAFDDMDVIRTPDLK